MKSTTSVINGILAVAIIVLFVLHFNNKSTPSTPASVKNGSGQIAYFEIDSIQNNYELFKEVKAALESKNQQNQHKISKHYLNCIDQHFYLKQKKIIYPHYKLLCQVIFLFKRMLQYHLLM